MVRVFWEKYLIWVLAGVFMGVMVVVKVGGVFAWEVELLEYLRRVGGLEGVAEGLAWVGSGWGVAVLGGGLLLLAKPRWAVVIGATGVIEGALNGVLKQVVSRPRPEVWLGWVEGQMGVSGYGFPSGHTTLATALAVIVAPYMAKRWRWVVWVYPVLMGWSRVYLGKHWPLDVVGGWVLGIILGSVVRKLVSRRKKLEFNQT